MYIEYGVMKGWNTKENLERAAAILGVFNQNDEITDINKVIELYNIHDLISNGTYLKEWNEERIAHYKQLCPSIMKVVGKFFASIDSENFLQICHMVCTEYNEEFWELFVKNKAFEKVSGQIFMTYLKEPETTLWILLKHKKLAEHYDKELADFMRASDQTPRLIISQFLKKHDNEPLYHFPKELSPQEYEDILQNYVNSDTVNLNDLQLLTHAQNSKECPISDKLRLAAKRACDTYWDKHPFEGVRFEYGIGMEFAEEPNIISEKMLDNNNYQLTYDINWLRDNLDYPTILNNFRYVFEQFDTCWRSQLVSIKSQLETFESLLSTRGIKEYVKGLDFYYIDNLSTAQVDGYYKLLKNKGVQLENVFKWFFEEYLPQEFGAYGFRFNPPSDGTTLVEKCRNIASEMDGVLKQFRMYVQDSEIDRELFEISSEHIKFSSLSGFSKEKYAYGESKNIENMLFLLFSDQSRIYYIKKLKHEHTCFFDLLTHENVRLSDFLEYQQEKILWLIDHDIVIESEGCLKMNITKAAILKDLYDHDVICPQYYNEELKSVVDEWCRRGDFRFENTLFSKPEQDYLNFELNKADFSDGLDLRNKYIHSSYPEDKNTQYGDYVRLLKIMILVITKINEEFCLRDQMN